jgi:hypothetical protein
MPMLMGVPAPNPAIRAFRIALVGALVALVMAPGAVNAKPSCRGDGETPQQLSVKVDGQPDPGFYVAPARKPRALVVFSHGHGASPMSWFGPMARVAQRDRAIAVAMYYPGERILDGGRTTWGWFVREGAQAGVAAARAFLRACPWLTRRTIVDYGVSMGGNTSGLMAAMGAKRPGGRPLFDYWFDIEGVTNVIETYLEAVAVAQTGNATGAQAVEEIEEENGGTLAERPAAYRDLAVVSHAEDIAAAGIKGVVLVHGLNDGLVPYDQSREMEARLIQAGVPTDFYTVATKTPGTESGTVLDGYVPVPHESPFAGHGGEDDQTHLVIRTGLEALDALLQHGVAPRKHRQFLADGTLGETLPLPGP